VSVEVSPWRKHPAIRLHLRLGSCDATFPMRRLGLACAQISSSHSCSTLRYSTLLYYRPEGQIRACCAPGITLREYGEGVVLTGQSWMPSHHRRSSARRTTLLLSLLLFISTAALFYIRARWSRPVLPHPFPASVVLDQTTGSLNTSGAATSCNCTSATMPDPGIFPGGKTQSKQGWNVMPDVRGATLDTTTFRVGSGTLVSEQRSVQLRQWVG
jgi:hypothetical protein